MNTASYRILSGGLMPAILAVCLLSTTSVDAGAFRLVSSPQAATVFVLKWEAYRVETTGSRLIIAGSDECGTMFGLYAFIEKYLGVDPVYYWASLPDNRGLADH